MEHYLEWMDSRYAGLSNECQKPLDASKFRVYTRNLMKYIDMIRPEVVPLDVKNSSKSDPNELLKELDECLKKLEQLIWRINLTNVQTVNDAGKTLTQLMAEKDVLKLRISTMRNAYEIASAQRERYTRTEIKMLTTIDVKQLRKQIDEYSVQLRKLDMEIQSMNFTTELV